MVKQATDKQKALILRMLEAHWDKESYDFTIYRGKPSAWHAIKGDRRNWSQDKRSRSKTVKEYRKQVLNDEWTVLIAMDFIRRHYDDFMMFVAKRN